MNRQRECEKILEKRQGERFKREYKREVVDTLILNEWSVKRTADHYGLSVNTVRRWLVQGKDGLLEE